MKCFRRRLFGSIGALALTFGLAGAALAEIPLPVPKPASISMKAPAAPAMAARPAENSGKAGIPRADPVAPSGTSGWLVVDLDTGQVIDSAEADLGFVPASVAKLPTAAFALHALGPDHRFQTRLLATGPIQNGRLKGDLVLQGGGDPELDTDALLPLVQQLAATGLRSIEGRFLADGSALPQQREITTSQEMDSAYNPSTSGLNLNFNRVHVKWDARKGKERLSVEAAAARLSPPAETVRVLLASNPNAPLFSLREEEGLEVWEMAQSAYRGRAARWLPVKRPEIYAAHTFRALAAESGITLPPALLGKAPGGANETAMVESRPLGVILESMLKYSTNLTAELVGSTAAKSIGGDFSTLRDSAAVMGVWASELTGFPHDDPGFHFVNHSGLTLESRVSPRQMVALLTTLAGVDGGSAAGLPAGIARYLDERRIEGAPAGLEIVAKSGTMSFIRGLAGYALTPGGRRLAFAIFSNDLAMRSAGPEQVNRPWLNRARGFEQALLRRWAMEADAS